MSLGLRIKDKRKELGITQAKLAEMIGIRQPTLSDLEKGVNNNTTKIVELAKALKTTPDFLLYGKEQSNMEILPVEVATWDNDSKVPDDMVEVPYFMDMSLSAGYGAINNGLPYVGTKLWYSKGFIRRKGACLDKVFCIKVHGDSMDPVFEDGGIVMIDTEPKDIIDGKPYAISYQDSDYLKFLRRLPDNKIRVISANPEYDTFDADTDDVQIIGRVIEYSKEW